MRHDDATKRLLRDYALRRRHLALLRGIAALATMLVFGLAMAAALDRFASPAPGTRVAVSMSAYLAAVLVAWFAAGRVLRRGRTPSEAAADIELAEPALRDRLVAAVELDTRAIGSPAFKRAVHNAAAERAAGVDVARVLPARRSLGAWPAVALLCLATLLVTACVPGLGVARSVARAALPWTDIARASAHDVAFVGDVPEVLPPGEPVRFEVAVAGATPLPNSARLEVREVSSSPRIVALERVGPGRFAADVALSADARVRAESGDAVTRWRAFEVRPRPAVVGATGHYEPPSYLAGAVGREAVEPAAGGPPPLRAVRGSTAVLRLRSDQPVSSGTVEFDGGGSLPLEADDGEPGVLVARVPVEADGAYRVRLVSADGHLSSAREPLSPIRADEDAPPTLEAGEIDTTAAFDDVVNATAQARDDLALEGVSRDVRVNAGPWQRVDTVAPSSADPQSAALRQPLDLLPLNVGDGDRVEVRAVARDLAGSESVAALGTWRVVDADDASRQQREQVAAWAALASAARRLADDAAASDLAERGLADDALPGAREASLERGRRAVRSSADAVANEAGRALTVLDGGVAAHDAERVGRLALGLADDGDAATWSRDADHAAALAEAAHRHAQADLAATDLAGLAEQRASSGDAGPRRDASDAAKIGRARRALDEARVGLLGNPVALARADAARRRLLEAEDDVVKHEPNYIRQAAADARAAADALGAELTARRDEAGEPSTSSAVANSRSASDARAAVAARAALHARRADTDAAFLADLALADRAVGRGADARAVARPLATLEAGHAATELADIAAAHADWAASRRPRVAEVLTRAGVEASIAGAVASSADLSRAVAALAPTLAAARAELAKFAGPTGAALADLADAAERAAEQSRQHAESDEIAAAQAELEARLDEADAALRAEATMRQALDPADRDAARAAEEARATLARVAQTARQMFEAVQARQDDADAKRRGLDALTEEQSRLAETAARLAREGLEGGDATAEAAGSEDALDRLAHAAASGDDGQLREALEHQAQADAEMRRELARLAARARRDAGRSLAEAADAESKAADTLSRAEDEAQAWREESARAAAQLAQAARAARDVGGSNLNAAATDALDRAETAGEAGDLEAADAATVEARAALDQHRVALGSGRADATPEELKRLGEQGERVFEAYRKLVEETAPIMTSSRQRREQADAARREATADASARHDRAQEQTREAAEALDRAARHDRRAGDAAETDGEPAGDAASAAEGQVAEARRASDEAAEGGEAGSMREAASAARRAAGALREAQAQAGSGRAPSPARAGGTSDPASALAARALDRLDAGGSGEEARTLIEQATRERSRQERIARAGPITPGGSPAVSTPGPNAPGAMAQGDPRSASAEPSGPAQASGPGGVGTGEAGTLGAAPEAGGRWGDLPPRTVEGLRTGEREAAPPQYRDVVDAYYRAVAERARRGG